MSALLMINRGPVDEIIDQVFERVLTNQQDYSEWQDFPHECFPATIIKCACDDFSQEIISLFHSVAREGNMQTGIVANYILDQLWRFGISPHAVRYVYLTPTAIELTLEVNHG